MQNTLIKLALLPLSLLATSQLETESMLFQAEKIAKAYAPLVAKATTPAPSPQTDALLAYASNWLSIDLTTIQTDGRSVLGYLSQPSLWDTLAEIGIDAVELKGLKSPKPQVSFQIDPQFGTEAEYAELSNAALKKGIRIVGQALGKATGKGADFALALKNIGAYPELYEMVEIDPQDWDLLPEVKAGSLSVNIPWLTVQNLHKKGYVQTQFDPYVKQTAWNATRPIVGIDQVTRRWVYLRNPEGFPELDWLNPSFGALRLSAADILFCRLRLGQPIIQLEKLPQNTEETLCLTIRKLGGFSVGLTEGGVKSLCSSTDASYDPLTPNACLQAIRTENVASLRLLYDLLLTENIPLKRLVHALEPFGRFPHEAEKVPFDEVTTSNLQQRTLQQNALQIKGENASSWQMVADRVVEIPSCDPKEASRQIAPLQLSLAQFFAFQPGIFSITPQDLLGALPAQKTVDLLGPNSDCLYSCAPNQLLNPRSFASQLKKILRVRKKFNLANARLVETIPSENKGLLILKFQLTKERMCALLSINCGKTAVDQILESHEYAHTTATNPMTGLAEKKSLDSSFFELHVEPLSTKLIVFQPKYAK